MNLVIEGNETLTSQVEKYCTKSFKISDLFSREKEITLIQEGDNQEVWKVAWNKYVAENQITKNPLDIANWKTGTTRKKPYI